MQIGPFGSLLHKSDYVLGGVPVINPMHILDDKIVADPAYAISPEKADVLGRYRLVPGEVILGRRGEMGRCATVTDLHQGMICGTGSMKLIPDRRILSPDYLAHMLRTPKARDRLENAASGVTMMNLNAKALTSLEIPLPPLAEQKRIAAILDQADALRRLRRRALDRLNTLAQAIFQEMFGDPVGNGRDLPVSPLAQVATFVSGATPSKSDPSFWGGGVPWVTPKDMKRSVILSAEDSVSSTALASSPLKMIPTGTPLIVVRGMILAHTIPMALTGVDCTINQDMKAIRFDDRVLPEFGLYCLRAQHESMLKRIDTAAHGTRRFDMSRLGETPILMAAIKDQRRFVDALGRTRAMVSNATKAREHAHSLFASLQHRAYTAQL